MAAKTGRSGNPGNQAGSSKTINIATAKPNLLQPGKVSGVGRTASLGGTALSWQKAKFYNKASGMKNR